MHHYIEAVEEIVDMRAKVARAIGKMMNRIMAAAFETWWFQVLDTREHNKKMELVLHKAVKRMQNIVVTRAFHRWAEYAAERGAMRRKVRRYRLTSY